MEHTLPLTVQAGILASFGALVLASMLRRPKAAPARRHPAKRAR